MKKLLIAATLPLMSSLTLSHAEDMNNHSHTPSHLPEEAVQKDAFPKGDPAPAYFTGKAWVSMLVNNKGYDISAYNVTFAPGTRNNWHSHAMGQLLFCTTGIGYYQERGKPARRLAPGDVVEIPAHTEHWHGAAPHSTFTHLGITPVVKTNTVTWGAPVTDAEYTAATQTETSKK